MSLSKTVVVKVSRLVELQMLKCDHNLLTSLPTAVFDLSQLSRFFCGNNKISVIPAAIGMAQMLVELLLDHNSFTELPQEVFQLITQVRHVTLKRVYLKDW